MLIERHTTKTEVQPNATDPYIAERNELHFVHNDRDYLASGVRWVHPTFSPTEPPARGPDGPRPVHEVLIFPATTEGEVADWIEVYGVRGTTDVLTVAAAFAYSHH